MTGHDLYDRLLRGLETASQSTSDYDLNPDIELPKGRKLRDAAVLVPIQLCASGPRLILTKRASGMKHHPGQIAFPGGKIETSDHDATAAATREAKEEIGLLPGDMEILGQTAAHETVTGFSVYPIFASVTPGFTPVAEPGEVAEVFSVPLSHVLDKDNYVIQGRFWQGRKRYYYTVPYGPYYIWGATARILRATADLVAA